MTDAPATPRKRNRPNRLSPSNRIPIYLEAFGPCCTADLAEYLQISHTNVMAYCQALMEKKRIHKQQHLWALGPAPEAELSRAERYIPGPLVPTRHWSADIPPERMLAFQLPSRVGNQLVYPRRN